MTSAPRTAAAPKPPAPIPPQPFVASTATFDPLAIPLPPEVAPNVYGWLRRLALQADLGGADRVLRDALADLTSALSVLIVYPSADGPWSLNSDDEIPRDHQPFFVAATTRRAVIGTHTALIPIATTTETVAVIQLTRNPRQPAFGPQETISMAALARESAAIFHHLALQHLQRANEHKADRSSLYRPEALESHRTRGNEGVLTELSPGWVKRAYPVLVVTILVAIGFAVFTHVPTYSTGSGVIVFEGKHVTTPLPGTVEAVHCAPGQQVHTGDLLVKLNSSNEDAQLAEANTQLESAIQQYLFDSSDETVRKSLVSAESTAKRMRDNVEARSVRATKDGVISDVRIRLGSLLNPGDHIASIIEPGTDPEVIALLPGTDRPRLHPGQALQVDLTGFVKARETATIMSVSSEVVGVAEARRTIGPEIADAMKLEGSYVIVRAHLPTRTFKTDHRIYRYHHGMLAKTEVRVETKRFIVTLLPSLEKYLE